MQRCLIMCRDQKNSTWSRRARGHCADGTMHEVVRGGRADCTADRVAAAAEAGGSRLCVCQESREWADTARSTQHGDSCRVCQLNNKRLRSGVGQRQQLPDTGGWSGRSSGCGAVEEVDAAEQGACTHCSVRLCEARGTGARSAGWRLGSPTGEQVTED